MVNSSSVELDEDIDGVLQAVQYFAKCLVMVLIDHLWFQSKLGRSF